MKGISAATKVSIKEIGAFVKTELGIAFRVGFNGAVAMARGTAKLIGNVLRTGFRILTNPLTLIGGVGTIYAIDKLLDRMDTLEDSLNVFQKLTGGSADQARSWADQLQRSAQMGINFVDTLTYANR